MNRVYVSKISALANYPLALNASFLRVMGVFVFIILTALGAFVRIPLPFTPVPFTLQTFFVLFSGAVLGRKYGALSQAGYVVLGMAGIPIFSGANAGVAWIFGPTGGYLLGFVAAAFMTGALLNKRRSFFEIMIIFLAATITIYFFGVSWMMFFLKISLAKAILMGALPFIIGDVLKFGLAAVIYEKLKIKFN
ncbi:MAG: biotin transporter BioY [Candidatus Omnitrophota bacterium]